MSRLLRRAAAAIAGTAISLCLPGAVLAHPHIFIDATATVVFDDSGAVSAIRHAWTFDEAFSVWQVQGLDTDGDGTTSPEEMQELADENLIGLSEYGFYTFAGEGSDDLHFVAASGARFTYEAGRSTLSFTVAPSEPYLIRKVLEIAVNDPDYYVAITFADASAVTLENAPAGCAAQLLPPEPMDDALAEQLYALPPDLMQLPADLAAALRGVQGAIVVSCPAMAAAVEAEPVSAADAADRMAESVSRAPFGGPPPEPGFTMPRSGILGWIAEQQRQFYQSLTAALGALKRDGTAFWVLGSLSFLYGVFHAAGPGHGKVIISSYVLANERQVRQGIALSFAAALLQSFVAIAFVLVAAAALNLSAAAMNDAAHWIGIASYALVALLGLWLVGRKLFGRGHSHGPSQHGHHQHDHEHEHGHHHHDHDHHGHDHEGDGHHHVVTPGQLAGGWREQLGVVLAVGLRPCSGALVVLAFALSQGLVLAGIAAVLLMGLGTALTVAILASMAVGMKGLATGMARADGVLASRIVWWAELLGALAVLGFGVVLLLSSL